MTCNDVDLIDAAPPQLVDDVSDHGRPGEGKKLLLDAHAARLAGSGYDGNDHGSDAPRRTAMS